MKTIDRYIVTQFMKVWLICVIGAPIIFIIFQVADELDRYLSRGLSVGQIALGYVYEFPYQMGLSFPVASLFGAVFTIALMSRHFEITAAKASGISFYRLMRPIVALGAILSLASLGLGELVPVTNRLKAETLEERAAAGRTLRTNFVYAADGGRAYTVERLVLTQRRIEGLIIDREGTGPEYPTYRLYAPRAVWDGDLWKIENGQITYYPERGRAISFAFDTLVERNFSETPEQLMAEPKDPDQMGYEELGRFIESIQRSGGDVRGLVVQRMLKIAFPFSCLIIVLFGAPLGMSTGRRGPAVGVGVALATVLIYLIMVRIAQGMGAGGLLTPWLAAWLPNLVFLVLGLGLLARTRT